jgi:hypothetical protein
VEDSDEFPSCYNPLLDTTSTDAEYGLAFAQYAFGRIGLPDRWAYHDAHKEAWSGPAANTIVQTCRTADLLLNLSGANPLRPWTEQIPVRAFIDTDPGFTQARNIKNESARRRVGQHNVFFTFAELVGRGACLPDDGVAWKPTRQPVMLELWPVRPVPREATFTAVMVWESYPPVEIDGLRLGLKAQSFGPYINLPKESGVAIELALGGGTAPRSDLMAKGWRLRDSREPTRTIDTYQDYLAASLGEFGIAKQGYVITHSGWFSERSANYLAAGRPVVAQDTGFSAVIPTGEGLLAFSNASEAVDALRSVAGAYESHRKRAREIAESYFDSRQVLPELLAKAFAQESSSRK